MSNVKTLAPSFDHRPSNDGVAFRRQASSASRAYPPPPTFDGPRSAYPPLFHHVYRDYPSQGQPPTAQMDPQAEYAFDGDGHLRRRPALLPGPPLPADYSRICRSRYYEQHFPYPFELVAEPESFSALKRPRLSNESKVSPQQPLVIDIRDAKKEAYLPQTEAVSPGAGGEQRSPKDELLQGIKRLEQSISQLESQAANLSKRKLELEAVASRPPDVENASETPATVRMSTAQRIYSENRKKAQISNSHLEKLGNKFEFPLYHQPIDTPSFHQIRKKFVKFKCRLTTYFKRRHRDQQRREEYLTETYANLMHTWLKKMDRRENNGSRRSKEAKLREFFEKQFPELKKQREDKERFSRVGQRIRSDAELEEIMDGLQEQEMEDKKMRSLAVVPPMMLPPHQRTLRYINNNGLIEDLAAEYKARQLATTWTEQEKDIFREKFLQHPKAFVHIAASLERKTVADCVHYYYLTKKTERYKQLLRKNVKRRRTLVKPPAQQQQVSRQQDDKAASATSTTTITTSTTFVPHGVSSSESTSTGATIATVVTATTTAVAVVFTDTSGGGDTKSAPPKEENPVVAESNTSYPSVEVTDVWPIAEAELFKHALALHGTKWKEIAKLLVNKTSHECRSFFMSHKHTLGLQAIVKEYRKRERAAGGGKLSEDEESGETTSSCDEDNCVDRSSSDTTSAPSPIEGTSAEKDKEDVIITSTERPREELKTDYDSSATVSADEGQAAAEDKFARPAVPAPDGKEEPTCVRDLIYQAIEMSLQGGPSSTVVPKKPTTPPVAHRPAEVIPIAFSADQSEDYQVQDLSKKSSKSSQENYSKSHHFVRPSETNMRAYPPPANAPQYGPPPPAHFNNRPHELASSSHYGDSVRQDGTFYVHPSSTDKIFDRAPPHLVAQVPTAKTPPLRKSKVPPVPPLTKLQHYKGSITQGTPNAIRYEGGSITLGTPVQHDLKRNPQMELYDKPESVSRSIVYDNSVIDQYYRQLPHYPGGSLHAFTSKIPFSNESQLSSKQIMIDFNTSKQMQMRRGSTAGGEKETILRASPRSRDQPLPTHYGMYMAPDSRMAASPETTRQNVIQRWGSKQPSVIQSAPRPLPPTCHEAFNALVNAAAAQPNLNIASMQKDEKHPLLISGISRPALVEGLEKSLIDMHQRPRTYADAPEQYARAVEAASKHYIQQPSNSSKESEIHYYESNTELDKQKFSTECPSPHPSLRISGMREPFSREQFERQMRQDMGVARPGHDLSFNKKEEERKKGTKVEEKKPHYQQQVELDNEASRIFSQSFQKDSPKTTSNPRGFTAANLIDAIITRQINQNTDGTKSDMFNRYQRPDQRITTTLQPKRKSREEVVTIDDEPEKERISFTHSEQRPGSSGRSSSSAQEPMYNVSHTGSSHSDKNFTLGEHIASIISKDYSAPNSQASYFSHSRPLESTITSTIHRESPHILAASSTHSPIDPQGISPSDSHNVDHTAQNCPGKGCVFHHSWKLRNALQQNKESDSIVRERDRNIIQVPSQPTPPPQGKVSSKSPIATSYIVEPISPPNSTPEPQSTGEQPPTWSTSGLPSLLPAAPRLYEAPTGLQLSPLDYVKNRIVEVMRTQDPPKTAEEKGASSTMPHLSEEPARYLEPRESPQRFSPYMPVPKQTDSELINNSAHWSNEGRVTPIQFRSLSPDDQRPRKKFKTGDYTTPEKCADKVPESISDQNYAEGNGPRCESSHGSEASSEAESSNATKQNEGNEKVEAHHTSRIEPVSPPSQTSEAGPTTPYSLVSSSSSPAAGGYVSYPYPYSALTVRCLPLPPSTSLHTPSTPATIASSPPTEPQPAPLLSSQYEPLSDED